MRYLVVINDEELRGNGDILSTDEVAEEVSELLRGMYFMTEAVIPLVSTQED